MSVIAAIGILLVIISYWHLLLHYLNTSGRRSDMSKRKHSSELVRGMQFLDEVMEALIDPNTHLIRVFGQCKQVKQTFLEIVNRRIEKDKLFDLVLTATLTKRPDVKKIQDELASQLKYTLKKDSTDKRAQELIKRIYERIKIEQKILIVLCDLHQTLDLGKVGIPSGTDPKGCKILITSTSGDVLYNHKHTQKIFMV